MNSTKWIARRKDGALAILPMSSLAKEIDEGNQTITLLGLVEIEQGLTSQIEILQTRVEALETDYQLLVERYNRLAAINSAPIVVNNSLQQPSRRDDAWTQYLLFRSLFNTPQNRMQLGLRVSDCTRFPALCVR